MNIFKKLKWLPIVVLSLLFSITTTAVIAATEDNKLKFTVSSPKTGETIVKGKTTDILWTITGTEDNLESLVSQDRISRVYLMEKVYKNSGATSNKTAKLLKDISLDGEIECNDANTVCSLNQSYEWNVSTKLKSSSQYFIRVYLRPQPNFFSGLAKFFTLNNRWVYNDSGIFIIKVAGETVEAPLAPVVKTPCSPKLKYIQIGNSIQSCCVGLKACQLSNGNSAICLSNCDAETVKKETSPLSSVIKITGEVDNATTMTVYPSSLVPQKTEGTFEKPAFQISKNTDGTYKIHWFNGTFGAGNVIQTLIKDQTGKIVFDSNKIRFPDSGFADFDVILDGKQKYTIVLDKVFGSDKNIEYMFDSSLINGGTKITNNVLNKSFTTADSFFSFLNTAISSDGKSFGIDFDLKDTYGYYATRPVSKIVVTLGDGTQRIININDSFLSQQSKGIVLPITGGDKSFKVDLYDSNGNKIESKTLAIASNQNITLVTDYKGATGWKSVYDPSISISSEGFYGTTSWKKYTINYDATGASRIDLVDANGLVIASTAGSSMTLTDKQLIPNMGYYLMFYDTAVLTHTEYISIDSKGNYDNTSLTDPFIYFTSCQGGRYYVPDALRSTLQFIGDGSARNITFNKDGYIDMGQIQPGQRFTMSYIDPIDKTLHIYNVTVLSEKLPNGSYKLNYGPLTDIFLTYLNCAKQGKSCLDSNRCQKGSIIGMPPCGGDKVCCIDICESSKVSCDGNCVETSTFTTDNNCGACGVKCDALKSEKCESKDGKYQCVATTAIVSKNPCILNTVEYKDGETVLCKAGECVGSMKCNDGKWVQVTADNKTKASCKLYESDFKDGETAVCKVELCDGFQKCNDGKWTTCVMQYDNCDPKTGRFTQPGGVTDPTPPPPPSCIDTCQPSGCNFSTQSVGNGTCTSLDKPYCCKNTPTAPTEESPNCYTGSFKCGTSCCSITAENCVNEKCVAKESGCASCGTANCGECSSATNGYRCICSGTKGTGYSSCQGQPDDSCKTNLNPCTAGTLSCSSDCCTANEECINNQCQLKDNGCSSCATAPCGGCTSMNNGYLCVCTGTKGSGYASCSGKLDPSCPGYPTTTTPSHSPVPSASAINLFSRLKQILIKWFK
ncbi:MAG: hypothetical protein NTX26_01195 [Candidatus Parcubacteria bacterium]|nr:hypothetical protein [Candidatus Parcubacteria bacterium]